MNMAKKDNDEFRPSGTIAVLIVFVITLVLIWGTIYAFLLNRGGTL